MKGRERRVCVCERESFVVWGGCVEGRGLDASGVRVCGGWTVGFWRGREEEG